MLSFNRGNPGIVKRSSIIICKKNSIKSAEVIANLKKRSHSRSTQTNRIQSMDGSNPYTIWSGLRHPPKGLLRCVVLCGMLCRSNLCGLKLPIFCHRRDDFRLLQMRQAFGGRESGCAALKIRLKCQSDHAVLKFLFFRLKRLEHALLNSFFLM